MKRHFLSIIAIAGLALGLASCSSENTPPPETIETTTVTETTSPTEEVVEEEVVEEQPATEPANNEEACLAALGAISDASMEILSSLSDETDYDQAQYESLKLYGEALAAAGEKISDSEVKNAVVTLGNAYKVAMESAEKIANDDISALAEYYEAMTNISDATTALEAICE